jgi:WD40 repeat protein
MTRTHTIACFLLAAAPVMAQGRPSTDVWVVPIREGGTTLTVGEPRNLTHRTGYDNQPSFTRAGDALLYTAAGDDGQTDIWRVNVRGGAPVRVTNTPESEYSPLVTPDGKSFSVIRVERDSTQRLWKFPLDGIGDPELVLRDVKPVGYHVWASEHQLVLQVLGGAVDTPAMDANTLQLADERTGKSAIVGRRVGRALVKVPGRDVVTFLQLVRDSASWIAELDARTGVTRRLMPVPDGADYHAWTPGGLLVAAAGSKLYLWNNGAWGVAADLGRWGVKGITRLAVSPKGDWLAFVAEDRAAP